MSERTAFPDGIPVPSDPEVPLTPEQLEALFPDEAANRRFVKALARGTAQLSRRSGDEEEAAS